MNNFLILAFLFFIGCTAGWVLELFYRRFAPTNKSHKWINPGFLNGPYLPLYGFALCIMFILSECEGYLHISDTALSKTVTVLIMGAAMTLIEYIAGLIFIKGMHVKLWDYSKRWGNIDGIICPLFSLFWTVLCALYLMFIHPGVRAALSWFADNLAFSFVIGFFFGVFSIDVVCSFRIVSKIKAAAEEYHVLVRYEEFKEHIREYAEASREKYAFLFAFSSKLSIREHIKSYAENLKKLRSEKKEK